jgi:hypothetical protein
LLCRWRPARSDVRESLQLDRDRISEFLPQRFHERLAQRSVEKVSKLLGLARELRSARGGQRLVQERIPHTGRDDGIQRLAQGVGQ